jgi:hypothetical protein
VGDCPCRLSEVTVKLRNIARWCAPAVLIAALLTIGPTQAKQAPGVSSSGVPAAQSRHAGSGVVRLPGCTRGGAPTHAPTTPAGPDAPGACRADGPILESGVQLSRPAEAGFTPAGYHHLGANTSGEWSGVSGRISVVHGSVRPRSYDFVAGRFMVKRDLGGGNIAWLEAGWAETGWTGTAGQHIYTFNTNTKTWQFYNQYVLKPGDRIWLDVHSDTDGVWGAWLWWNNRWNLLTAQKLPIGAGAYVEQYVEVHVDDGHPTRVDVPTVTVDNVQLKPVGGGAAQYWRADVPTLTGTAPGQQQRAGGFCLTWLNPYDTWTAGDCRDDDTGGGLLITKPAPLPSGEAEVVPPSATPAPAPSDSESTAPAAQEPGAVATRAGAPTAVEPSPPAPAESPAVTPSARPGSARRGLLSRLLG